MNLKQIDTASATELLKKTDTNVPVSESPANLAALSCLIDLHLHLDGSISLKSARELADLQGIALPEEDADVQKMLCADESCKDLNEFLEKFELPSRLLQTKEALTLATENLLRELKEDGVMYAEIRFAPQFHTRKGLSIKDAVQAVLAGMKNSEIDSVCILCCMRGTDNYQQNIETIRIAADYLGKGVGAIDLAGAEAIFPTKDFEYIFALAKELGIPFTIHAGEADGPESVKKAVEFGAKRIGHGVRAAESEEVLALLKENQVTLELCPSSNLRTKIFEDISAYPLERFQQYGIPFTINTDDMTVVGTDIKTEYSLLSKTFHLSQKDIHDFLYHAVHASFAEPELKQQLKKKIDRA